MKKIYIMPMISVEKMDLSLLGNTSDIYVVEEEGELNAKDYSYGFFEDEEEY